MSPRVLVAGVGNIFLGDDGFGVEVARRLVGETLPDGVQVADFGIRGVHLAYQLLDGYDTAHPGRCRAARRAAGNGLRARAGFPGARKVSSAGTAASCSTHTAWTPRSVLGILADLGGTVGRVVIVGCEPAEIVERMGLSDPVSHAVDEAARVVRELIARALRRNVHCGAGRCRQTKGGCPDATDAGRCGRARGRVRRRERRSPTSRGT